MDDDVAGHFPTARAYRLFDAVLVGHPAQGGALDGAAAVGVGAAGHREVGAQRAGARDGNERLHELCVARVHGDVDERVRFLAERELHEAPGARGHGLQAGPDTSLLLSST